MEPKAQLTGIEKASVLLMSLGPDASEQVMSRLSPEQRDVLGAQIVRMRSVTGDKSAVRDRVLDEVRRHCRFALLDAQFDARPVSDRAGSPFKWLEACEPDKVTRMLSGERPRTVALVLSYLSPGLVASVMERLDDRVRDRVARSLAEGCPTSDDVVKTIDETMRNRALHPDDKHRPSEVLSILSALGDATSKARESVLAAILGPHSATPLHPPLPRGDEGGSRLAELSSLEDLSRLPDGRIRALLGGVDLDDLCLAIRVASDELKAAILRNVPPATAALLRERIQTTAQVRIREIENAQQRVLAIVMRAFSNPEYPDLVEDPPSSPLAKGGMRGGVEGEASVE